MGHLLEMYLSTSIPGDKGMTQLDFTLEAIRGMNDPCVCEQCRQWMPAGRLRPIKGSLNEKLWHPENRSKDVPQTIWVCLDCLDDER